MINKGWMRALAALGALVWTGCIAAAAPDGEDDASDDTELGATAGIAEGSPEAAGVLRVANEASVEVLDGDVGLTGAAASNILEHRDGPDPASATDDDDPFDTLAELDAVPMVGKKSFEKLLAYALSHGFVVTHALRVRLPAEVPADGRTQIPVFVETLDPGLATRPMVLSLSRSDAGTVSTWVTSIGPTSRVGDWHLPLKAKGYFLPCDAAALASCLGPVGIRVAFADDPATVLAEGTVELVPGDDKPSAAACLGGGNIMDYDFLTSYGFKSGVAAHTSMVRGKWKAAYDWNEYVNAPGFQRAAVYPHAGPSLTLTRSELEVGAVHEAWANGGAAAGSIELDGACGHGRFVIHEMEMGPESALHIAQIHRFTAAWELTCTMYQGQTAITRVLTGCVHYDRENPVLTWP